MKTLETDRLFLRPFKESDAADLYEYAKSPNVGPNAGWPPHGSMEASMKIINMFMADNDVWAIENKEDGKVIGSLGLHKDSLRRTDDVKMLGYVLSEDYWGKGIMTEAAKAAIRFAFEVLKINLLTVHHYSFNKRSKRVIEKCGFAFEGMLRHAVRIYDGSVYDLSCYSMTRDEYQHLYN